MLNRCFLRGFKGLRKHPENWGVPTGGRALPCGRHGSAEGRQADRTTGNRALRRFTERRRCLSSSYALCLPSSCHLVVLSSSSVVGRLRGNVGAWRRGWNAEVARNAEATSRLRTDNWIFGREDKARWLTGSALPAAFGEASHGTSALCRASAFRTPFRKKRPAA